MDHKRTDTANEPVDHDEFMDTGVLHEVYTPCVGKSCTLPHPHPTPQEGK